MHCMHCYFVSRFCLLALVQSQSIHFYISLSIRFVSFGWTICLAHARVKSLRYLNPPNLSLAGGCDVWVIIRPVEEAWSLI